MNGTLVTPEPHIARDRWGRPMVVPPDGGKPVAYTRCTTFIDVLDDKFNLQRWMQRMVALGLATRPDLLLAVSAHKDDKRKLDDICAEAREASAASAAATTGTALHALTELIDRGETLPPLPAGAKASLDAYAAATAHLKMLHIERFLVLDTMKIGGTPDRIVKDAGDIKIADTKTGSIEYGALKIAMQLAVYSRSYLYDIRTGERTMHNASTTEGLVFHVPATGDPALARCDLYRVNLEAGWFAVQVAAQVREKRKLKFEDLMEPVHKPLVEQLSESLEQRIRACTTADAVRALWTPEWTDELNQVARNHIATIPAAS